MGSVMIINRSTFWLFLVIVLEGYVVLSSELLAIRQSIPFTGSGTETVSVIIAAVLMPLAFGYYEGGKFKPKAGFSIRDKLIFNILVAMIFLLPGLSYVAITEMYHFVQELGLKHRLPQIILYSSVFIATPVFLLGQTIPLVSNYFGKERLAQITGRILFFSTLGSFLGAILSTLVLMATIGVNNTVAVNFVILAGLVLVLSKNKLSWRLALAVLIAIGACYLNSDFVEYKANRIIEHNKYNSVAVSPGTKEKHLFLNNSASSLYTNEGRKYSYIEKAEEWGLEPLWHDENPRDILVIGAGAFTFGYEDKFHNYDFVDIDGHLKDIAEKYILPEPLSENKHFHPMPARAFLSQTAKKYDVILLDTYFGRNMMPEHLLTLEFFEQIKSHMKPDSVMIANFVGTPNFVDPFTRNLDNTVRAVFPYVSRSIARDQYMPWNESDQLIKNILYIYRHRPDFGAPKIYTDNKNTVYMDKP